METTRYETRVGIFVLGAICIFICMSMYMGIFRFDNFKYLSYTLSLDDISGLSRKAEVKIAGVPVGWVEEITLVTHDQIKAHLIIKVLKVYTLHADAYGIIKQDNPLGQKYVELVTGSSQSPTIEHNGTLIRSVTPQASVGELLTQCRDIAQTMKTVTLALHDSIGLSQGNNELQAIMQNLSLTTQHLATFSSSLNSSFSSNQENIQALLEIGVQVKHLSESLERGMIPHAQETVSAISSIATKVNCGQGLLGKLVNDEQSYENIRMATQGLRNYFNTVDKLQVVCDTHFEAMMRPAENYDFEDAKSFFDLRLYPRNDYFLLLQIVGSEKGYVNRYEIVPSYIDCDGYYVDTKNIDLTEEQRLKLTYTKKNEIFTRGAVRFGVQLGKIFGNVALRLGMFENSVGAAIDINVPIIPDSLRWVSSLEAFDFKGWNRRDDRRPHFKWLNRMFFLRNFYLTFGADDIISKRNANIFFGGGLRFGDDEMKYMLSMISSGFSSAGGGLAQVISVNN